MIYSQAKLALDGRNIRKLTPSTYLRLDEREEISLIYHCTDIVKWLPDGRIILDNGGWFTVNTLTRIHKALYGDRDWFYEESALNLDIVSPYNYDGGWCFHCKGIAYKWCDGDKPCIHPNGKVTGVRRVLHEKYQEYTGCKIEVEELPEAVSKLDLESFKKLWGKSGGLRAELVPMMPVKLLPVAMGLRTRRGEEEKVRRAITERFSEGG